VPPQPFEQVTVFDPYEVELLDKGEQLQLVAGVQHVLHDPPLQPQLQVVVVLESQHIVPEEEAP